MIHDPQYLMWKDADKRYKQQQQKAAKPVFQENKELRKQIKERKYDIQTNYLTMWQANRFGITKLAIEKRIKEWKLKPRVVGDKIYYPRDEIVNCMG